MWDLVPWPWIEPSPSALGALNLNHWTTREAPVSPVLKQNKAEQTTMTLRLKECNLLLLYLKQMTSTDLCIAQGTLLDVMWQVG